MGFDTDDPDNGADMEIGGSSDRAEIGRLKGKTPRSGKLCGVSVFNLVADKEKWCMDYNRILEGVCKMLELFVKFKEVRVFMWFLALCLFLFVCFWGTAGILTALK